MQLRWGLLTVFARFILLLFGTLPRSLISDFGLFDTCCPVQLFATSSTDAKLILMQNWYSKKAHLFLFPLFNRLWSLCVDF